jgi:signal transduction histidine kinase
MIFAKPQPPKPALTSVQDIIKSAMEKVLSNTSAVGGRKIEFQEHSASVAASNHGLTSAGAVHVPLVFVDAQQVCDALTEVLNNAVQATDDHLGHISVSVVFDPYGRNAVISVVDNGRGMDEATLRRAFDPFFSAKSAGRRRGMGLAKAVRWIEGTGGSIRLESQPDQGTRALILLPVGEGQKTLIQEESSAAA